MVYFLLQNLIFIIYSNVFVLLQKQLHLSEMRADEEISERLKWEERCRNWKHSAEQLKVNSL